MAPTGWCATTSRTCTSRRPGRDALAADDFAGARALAAYRAGVTEGWHQVHVDGVDVDESIADLGSDRQVEVVVALGQLGPDDVEVQLVVGHVGQSGELESPQWLPMRDAGRIDDLHHRFVATAPLTTAGRMGVTARVVPRHDLVDTPLDFGLVAWAG